MTAPDTTTTDGTTTTTTTGQDVEPVVTDADKPTGDDTDWRAEAAKLRNQLRHAEVTARANSTAQKKLAAIEEAQKTEQQRLQDQLAASAKELDEYRAREVRRAAVAEAGLDGDLAEFLTASEPEAAAAQAKVLAKRLAPPKPDLKQGARPRAAEPQDMNDWLRKSAGYDTTP